MAGQPDAVVRDPSVYPVEDRVGEDLLHRYICELLRPLVQRWLDLRGEFLVGANQFVYYAQDDAHKRYGPDVYVLPGVARDTAVPSWKLWETGIAPSFALEVASQDWGKGYIEVPQRCAAIGVVELVIFDPLAEYRPRREGVRWQVYRWVDGSFVLVDRTDADRVRSDVLGCWLRSVGGDAELRVRLGVGPKGDELFPTAEEAERAAKETERAAKETERAAKEAERAAKEQALQRVAELEAELAERRRLEPGGSRESED